jgi:membrane protein DedA with SNARE-associated domain
MNDVIQFLMRHGYSVLFVWVFAEQLGLPIPAAPILLAAGAMAGAGKLNFILILVVGIAGTMLSDILWYQIGRYRGNRALSLVCRISLVPESCIANTKEVFGRHGAKSLLVAKFFPGLNAVSTPLAGTTQMSLPRFLIFDGLGALNWIGVFTGLGYLFTDQIERIAAFSATLGTRMGAALAAILAVFVLWKYLKRRRSLNQPMGGG